MKYIPCTLDEEKEILDYLGFDSFEEFISFVPIPDKDVPGPPSRRDGKNPTASGAPAGPLGNTECQGNIRFCKHFLDIAVPKLRWAA